MINQDNTGGSGVGSQFSPLLSKDEHRVFSPQNLSDRRLSINIPNNDEIEDRQYNVAEAGTQVEEDPFEEFQLLKPDGHNTHTYFQRTLSKNELQK